MAVRRWFLIASDKTKLARCILVAATEWLAKWKRCWIGEEEARRTTNS